MSSKETEFIRMQPNPDLQTLAFVIVAHRCNLLAGQVCLAGVTPFSAPRKQAELAKKRVQYSRLQLPEESMGDIRRHSTDSWIGATESNLDVEAHVKEVVSAAARESGVIRSLGRATRESALRRRLTHIQVCASYQDASWQLAEHSRSGQEKIEELGCRRTRR